MSRQTFTIPLSSNPLIVMRRLGYAPYSNRQGESSYVRRMTGYEFPRFHLYIQDVGTAVMTCSLHIDQKAPVIRGAHAHAGEYDSPQVAQEVDRLQGV
ncbi:hypothetical protein HY732_01445 [Candidatus Uhrbacteria bacterium]|nr:hypothetical protein [Candidatus Uhrbacteria bacterium]